MSPSNRKQIAAKNHPRKQSELKLHSLLARPLAECFQQLGEAYSIDVPFDVAAEATEKMCAVSECEASVADLLMGTSMEFGIAMPAGGRLAVAAADQAPCACADPGAAHVLVTSS